MPKFLIFIALIGVSAVYCDPPKPKPPVDNRNKPPSEQPQFSHVDRNWDLEATDRLLPSTPDKRSVENMDKELQNDLKSIRRFAQNVRPLAKNIRRSMNTRRGMGQEVAVMMRFIKDTILSLINTSDEYIPHLIPLTKYLRQFVVKVFGH